MRELSTFPRSDNPIYSYASLGFHYRPVSCTTPVTQYGVSYLQFLLHHADSELTPEHISMPQKYRPVHSWIRQITFIILTIDALQTSGLQVTPSTSGQISLRCSYSRNTVTFSRLYRASDDQRFHLHRQPEYQGERFKALPSHSTPWIISSTVPLFHCYY